MALRAKLRRWLAALVAICMIAAGLVPAATAAPQPAHPTGCAEDMGMGHHGSKAPTAPMAPGCMACCAAGPVLPPQIGGPDLASKISARTTYAPAAAVEATGRSWAPDPTPPRIRV